MRQLRRFYAVLMALMIVCFGSVTAFAYEFSDLPEGSYQIRAELSCYINAMGGVEFGGPLLESAQVNVGADGSKTMTLFLTKSSVTIYSITCDTFVDATPSYVTETDGVTSGTIGYYDQDGNLITEGVSYTLSEDTAENGAGEQIHYVDSITFPVTYKSDTYNLTLYVNSNVMGSQFTLSGYPAMLTVDWSSASTEGIEQSTPETESTEAASTGSVEKMDGLNIYRADEDETTPPEADEGNAAYDPDELVEAEGYIAFFRVPLIIGFAAVAVTLIVVGVVLVIVGRKEHEDR